jgi:putative endonuclease
MCLFGPLFTCCNLSRVLIWKRKAKIGGLFFMPCIYILYSEKLIKYYIGAGIEIERRLSEHNICHSKFTSLGMHWKLVYREEFDTMEKRSHFTM